MVTKQDQKTFKHEFESNWVPPFIWPSATSKQKALEIRGHLWRAGPACKDIPTLKRDFCSISVSFGKTNRKNSKSVIDKRKKWFIKSKKKKIGFEILDQSWCKGSRYHDTSCCFVGRTHRRYRHLYKGNSGV